MSGTLATRRLRAHITMDDGHEHGVGRRGLPLFLTVDEAAELLRTTLFTRWSSDANCLASCGFVDASCFAQTFC